MHLQHAVVLPDIARPSSELFLFLRVVSPMERKYWRILQTDIITAHSATTPHNHPSQSRNLLDFCTPWPGLLSRQTQKPRSNRPRARTNHRPAPSIPVTITVRRQVVKISDVAVRMFSPTCSTTRAADSAKQKNLQWEKKAQRAPAAHCAEVCCKGRTENASVNVATVQQNLLSCSPRCLTKSVM